METQFYAGEPMELPFGRPLAIAREGELSVLRGSVWLTRRGDPEDHLLRAGERMHLAPGDAAVLERLRRDEASAVAWAPCDKLSR